MGLVRSACTEGDATGSSATWVVSVVGTGAGVGDGLGDGLGEGFGWGVGEGFGAEVGAVGLKLDGTTECDTVGRADVVDGAADGVDDETDGEGLMYAPSENARCRMPRGERTWAVELQ